METKLTKSESNFSFYLDGEHQVEAELLSKTISEMATITKFASQANDPQAYLKMNVTAFKDGSFRIDFSTICEALNNLMVPAATLALTVVGTMKGFFEIKKFLKGKKAKNISELDENYTEIENSDGQKIRVPTSSAVIINNYQIDQAITNIASNVREHNPNGGFRLITENDEFVTTPEDIKVMSKPLPITEEKLCRISTITTDLVIKKPDILGHSMWSFRYNGQTIDASINDDAFIEKMHKGASIKAGDYITVTLEIKVDLDLLNKPIDGSEKYYITEVHGSIKHDYEQISLG